MANDGKRFRCNGLTVSVERRNEKRLRIRDPFSRSSFGYLRFPIQQRIQCPLDAILDRIDGLKDGLRKLRRCELIRLDFRLDKRPVFAERRSVDVTPHGR